MRKTSLLLATIIVMQSCQTYKTVNIPEMEPGKTYEITFDNGQDVKAEYIKVTDENISTLINDNVIEIPKSQITEIKKRKVSILKLAGGLALATVGIIILSNNASKDSAREQSNETN